jgi:hypothetical protein
VYVNKYYELIDYMEKTIDFISNFYADLEDSLHIVTNETEQEDDDGDDNELEDDRKMTQKIKEDCEQSFQLLALEKAFVVKYREVLAEHDRILSKEKMKLKQRNDELRNSHSQMNWILFFLTFIVLGFLFWRWDERIFRT